MALSDFFVDPATLPPSPAGFVQLLFLLAVYALVLFKASKLIADGSELLTLVLPAGLVGGLLLPILGAVPDAAIVLFSGMGPDAQEQLAVGVGTLAGSTIMLLTLPWAAAAWVGRVDLSHDGTRALYRQSPKLTKPAGDVTGTGVSTSAGIGRAAWIMLATAGTYVVVQGPAWAHDGGADGGRFALAGLVMSLAALGGYSAYCVLSAASLDAQNARAGALRRQALAAHLVSFSTMLGIEEEILAAGIAGEAADMARGEGRGRRSRSAGNAEEAGGASAEALMGGTAGGRAGGGSGGGAGSRATSSRLRVLFDKYDVNGDGSIDMGELKAMLGEVGLKVSDG